MNAHFEPADDAAQSAETRAVVLRYHLAWKERDLEAIMACYHPQVEYFDFAMGQVLRLNDLQAFVQSCMPRQADEALEHCDRIRVDGHTAFIQYRIRLRGSNGLVSFRASEAITVRDGLIWRIHEYTNLQQEQRDAGDVDEPRPALSRLGLSPRQLSLMAEDLHSYFRQQKAFLDPQLDLPQVAAATGYSRNQISHLLNQVLGQSFYRYVNQARLQHLLDQLDAGAEAGRIDELAFAAGFNSLSAFYKCFRERTGMTPKAYLRNFSTRART